MCISIVASLARDGAVDDEVGEVIEFVDLRTLSEVLGVLDGQGMEVEGVGEQVLGLVVHAVEIEPERSLRTRRGRRPPPSSPVVRAPLTTSVPCMKRFCSAKTCLPGMLV